MLMNYADKYIVKLVCEDQFVENFVQGFCLHRFSVICLKALWNCHLNTWKGNKIMNELCYLNRRIYQ